MYRPSISTVTPSLWESVAPSMAALAYPFLLTRYGVDINAGHYWLAGVQLCLAFCVSLVGFIAAVRLGHRKQCDAGTVVARRLAWLSVAAPPLYTATGVLLAMTGDPVSDTTVWLGFWLLVTLLAMASVRMRIQTTLSIVSPRLRIAHGVSALAILCLFLGMHLFNHLTAVIGETEHRYWMDLFRHIYRAKLVEPFIVLLFLFQVASGVQMLRVYSTHSTDVFRTLQCVSGAYLVFFILAHMNSVFFYARTFAGIPTDWNFATGAPAGLLHDAWNIRLVPHYTLGVFLVLTHILLGARLVLVAHGFRPGRVDLFMKLGIVLAAVFAVTVMAGMSGFHLR